MNSITTSNSSSGITGHFDELKREISAFHAAFDQWLASRQQVMTVDKQAFLKTLDEEQGNNQLLLLLIDEMIIDG